MALPIRIVLSLVIIFPKPLIVNIIPSVVSSGFILNFTIRRLLIPPINKDRKIPPRNATQMGVFKFLIKIPHNPPAAYATAATERSIKPVSNAYVIAQVIIIRGAPFKIVLYILLKVRKLSDILEKTIKSAASTK
jgi:hypothetical protein